MAAECSSVVDHADVLVVGLASRDLLPQILEGIRADQVVVDLCGLPRDRVTARIHHGICW
jgi:hypothetical protein